MFLKIFFSFFIFLPILVYFGETSFISYDEGFYALQTKWILENNNWLVPTWWGDISLDRTIGIQYLMALSRKIFGNNNFSFYIPNVFSSYLFLFLTYKIHKELVNEKYKFVSPIILSTTFLWINYVHLSTQDIVFSSLVTFGILSTIKASKNINIFFSITSGLWIGLAFMFKTFLVAIPLISILPVYFYFNFFKNRWFWLGLSIGFLPFLIWSFNIYFLYGETEYLGLFRKFSFLTKKNIFTNPFYYYMWNLPINLFPWGLFAILGFLRNFKIKNSLSKYFLYFYPLFTLILLSCFSTKTPYYPLQIISLLAINAYIGLENLLINKKIFYRYLRKIIFNLFPLLLFALILLINLNIIKVEIIQLQKIYLSIGLTFLGISWLCVDRIKEFEKKLCFIIIGSYLFTCLLVQSGLVSDRAREIRIASEKIIEEVNLNNKKVEVIKSDLGDQDTVSKIVKILVLMPKVGNGILNINDLGKDQYAWTTQSNIKFDDEKYSLINDSEVFEPWKLIKKN